MSLLSKIMKPIRKGLAPTSRRNIGGLEPRTPMPPKRKGGLGGLIQTLKGRLPERPISVGGVGGGIQRLPQPVSVVRPVAPPSGGLDISKSPLQQAFEKIQNSIKPIPIPPSQEVQLPIAPLIPKMPSFGLPDLSALQNISPAVKDAVQQNLATGEPILSPERVQEMIDQPPVAPPVTPPTLRESLQKIIKRPEKQMFIERIDNEPIRDISNNFVPPALGSTPPVTPPAIKEPSPMAPPRQLGVIKPPQRPIARPPLRKEDVVPLRPIEELIDAGVIAPPPVQQPIPVRPPQLPPKREPVMSIGGIGGGREELEQANLISGQPLVPGSATPREQTGLTAAELLELSDEELQRYIPRKSVGNMYRTYDATPSPEEFREQLQRQLNPDPNDLRSIAMGPRRYNPIDTSPQPTQDKRLGALLDIRGTGDDLPPIDQQRPMPPPPLPPQRRPIPPQDFGFGPGIRPTEIRGLDGTMIGSAGVTPPQNTNMIAELPPERIAEIGDPIRDEGVSYLGGSPTFNEISPPEVSDALQNAINNQTPVTDPVTPTVDPVTTAPTPSAPISDQGTDPIQSMPVGALDPVLLGQTSQETLTDPLVRALYFGTADQPGFYQQLQQAGANLIGQDVPLQQTAGLTPLELLARQQAVAGLGGFEPFLQQNRDLVEQAIAQSRRAEELQDPYYTQAEEIYKDTMGAYDPSMTQQFYNPFEQAVVDKTIQDVMEAGEKQDIASRAREISAGAFGGSRARLGAEERREALGEGLAQALGAIRQQGFSEAQRTGLSEFARQQAAKRTGAEGLMGIGMGRGSAASALGSQLAGYGSQIGGIGATQEGLRAGQRGELAGFGGIGRGIAETGLSRIYQQQLGQQQRPLGVLGQIGSMLPGYQQTSTQIGSQYGLPTDPSAAGLGAAFSAYGALAPRQGQS